jgi:hypothetical protein
VLVPAEWLLLGALTTVVVIVAPLVLLAALAGWLLRAPVQAALATPPGQILVAFMTWQPTRQEADTLAGLAIAVLGLLVVLLVAWALLRAAVWLGRRLLR